MQLSTSPGGPRFARTSKMAIQKVKHKLDQKKMVPVRRLAKEYNISKSSAYRILKHMKEALGGMLETDRGGLHRLMRKFLAVPINKNTI